MCLAIPFKLIEINGGDAIAEVNGVRRSVRVDLLKNPVPGDYVIVHAGFAIEKLTSEQALLDLEAWNEVSAVL